MKNLNQLWADEMNGEVPKGTYSEELRKQAMNGRKTEEEKLRSIIGEMYSALKVALSILEAEKEACGIYKAHREIIEKAIAKAEGK